MSASIKAVTGAKSRKIRKFLQSSAKSMIKEHVPSRYYVDLESFANLDSMTDYSSLLLRKAF